MISMDGNNSLKRVAKAGRSDKRAFDSDFFMSEDEVNKFADEVKSRPRTKDADGPNVLNPGPAGPVLDDQGGDPTDGSIDPCADRWRAAAAENLKKMWGIFRETGIFACACRHGLLLWMADMVESGEL